MFGFCIVLFIIIIIKILNETPQHLFLHLSSLS